jgi:hypothetical protein
MGMDDIYMCLWNGNSYETPQLLDSAINTSGYEYNAFISHDEQFIIFDRYNAPDGLGSGDLYISYKDKHGNWQPATNMGPVINSKYMDYCPFYDQGSEILYFTSRRSELAPMKFNDVSELKMATEVISNGQSRIYMVEFSPEAK